jgi:hypothetical protein
LYAIGSDNKHKDTCDIDLLKSGLISVIYTGSYMICDLITLPKKEPRSTYFHHLAVLVAVTIVHFNYGYIYLFVMMQLQEVSTIFLNLYKIYPKSQSNKLLFALTFGLFRIVGSSIVTKVWWEYPKDNDIDNIVFSLHLALLALNYYWFYLILKKIKKYY